MPEFPISGYSPAVSQLIQMGEEKARGPWPDYLELGISAEHIPELLHILADIEAFWPEGDTESVEVSAPIHAWRALGQLRAQEAVNHLIELIIKNEELNVDWVMEEIPEVLGMIGPVSIPAIQDYLLNSEKKEWASVTLGHCLTEIGKRNPQSRSACIAALEAGLENYSQNKHSVNGFLISYLGDLKAVEAAPLVERAYQANAVDLSIMGGFEDYQIKVGLLKGRRTPPPRFDFLLDPLDKLEAEKKANRAEKRRERQQAKKEKKKRKQAKKNRHRR